jgi:hypothetical protein
MDGQGLAERGGTALGALGGWAVQDSPPGSAALALHARTGGLDAGWLDGALLERREAVALYNPRTATVVLPAADVVAFTRGLLPPDEPALRHVLGRAVPPEGEGTAADDAVRLTAKVVEQALDGRTLSRDELHQALRSDLPDDLLPWCDGCRSHHARRGLLVAAGLHGRLCLAGRAGRQPAFARTDQWLAGSGASGEAEAAGASGRAGAAGRAGEGRHDDAAREVVRRYLRWYGPSTARLFGQWAGVSPAHARRSWGLVAEELREVMVEGGARPAKAWVLAADAGRLGDPPAASGVLLLAPGDPLLLARDRELLVEDPAVRRRVWQAINGPGIVLADGAPVALWRGRRRGRRLDVELEPLGRLTRRRLAAIEDEAERAAAHRGAATARVTVA